MESAESSKVRVIARVRGKVDHSQTCIVPVPQQDHPHQEIAVFLKDPQTSRSECFRLDAFFDCNVGRIFDSEVGPLIPALFRGCNATVFAYGATGSGKTYSMQGCDDEMGLMPLSMATILSMCQTSSSAFQATISYYEVYLDKCFDLLQLNPKEIPVWEDQHGRVHLRGLSRAPIHSMLDFHHVFSCAVQRRKVAHTVLNDVSSRSHAVLVIYVSTPADVLLGKLNLIDLAGNEDNRRTCNQGIRLQESAKINQSLFALSNIIFALNNNKPRVPYRDSKLTRILQDSLGGTSRALMVACLNPGEYQQSVHTVSLAARSRNISNFVPSAHKQETPKVKVDMEAKLCAWLESKGKSKSAKRIGAVHSPFLGKNSICASSVKKLVFNNSSVKGKVDPAARKTNEANVSDEDLQVQEYWSNTLKEEDIKENSVPVLEGETQNLIVDAMDDKNERKEAVDEMIVMESSNAESLDMQSNRVENSTTNARLSPVSETKKTIMTPSRKVLSPIDSNINVQCSEELPFNDQPACSLFFEPKTPQTPSVFANNTSSIGLQNVGTPLDKFNAQSSNFKNYLVQEYIHFLNTASREEMLELKGIGVKIAEYILELRETSPVKSLRDLEKIGLSTKQVHNLFNRSARGIFGNSCPLG